jgi:hypothetical protein
MRWVVVLVVSLVGVALGVVGLLLLRDDGPDELLPDLRQAAPMNVQIVADGDSYRLAFAWAVVNVGRGPVLIEAERPGRETPAMSIQQLVRRTDGTSRIRPVPGGLRYVESEPAGSWLLSGFEVVELRGAEDGELVQPGDPAGFCFRDDRQTDPEQRSAGEPERPVWTDECGVDQPGLLSVREGLSPGYAIESRGPGDRFVDVTNVSAGRYILVHRTNAERALEESDYENNASSVLIQLHRAGAIPSVRVLARCPGADVCEAG